MNRLFFQDFPCTGNANTNTDAPVLVLLHGWGMHSGVWQDFIPLLTPYTQVRCIDLPGFGRSAAVGVPDSLEDWADAVHEVMQARAVVVGWSLGGLIALMLAARYPQAVSHLVLIAANPCFVQREGWDAAMPAELFTPFAQALQQDRDTTLKRFLALQCRGSVSHKQDLRFLQACAAQPQLPSSSALCQGLALLEKSDLRVLLAAMSLPVLFLLGEQDALVPVSLAQSLPMVLPDVAVQVIPEAAHLPFLSHLQSCSDALLKFIGASA
ncbi:MAG: pimeloyl-ACP methyl ester esterase BioH [Moraxellaceae bacterium]|nr:pimeloyl-ACP methyl ester esterase BioH [Moraxellaceae bacterium]